MKYFIRVASVPVGQSGLYKSNNEMVLYLDSSYSDKVDFSISDTFEKDCFLEHPAQVTETIFKKVLNKATRYNKDLKREIDNDTF